MGFEWTIYFFGLVFEAERDELLKGIYIVILPLSEGSKKFARPWWCWFLCIWASLHSSTLLISSTFHPLVVKASRVFGWSCVWIFCFPTSTRTADPQLLDIQWLWKDVKHDPHEATAWESEFKRVGVGWVYKSLEGKGSKRTFKDTQCLLYS